MSPTPDTELADLKARSFQHFAALVERSADRTPDWKRTLLAMWRFGPELREEADNGRLRSEEHTSELQSQR